ncbi:retrovirus-related Pol polyprotein from transposon TNT 1-94 [Trichonephila clavipes]|uniref:Retrovirus-related Pol polyprotein from transposon TNT 1-94 n=1 Tax=Trichonephila clavipes TaxID=2585209 RepID=A0A8X6V5X0_TRICX|nr:retrovirus-related Pol polyprotein from transposon TNT 1-94 [Trichonephila clavipes]
MNSVASTLNQVTDMEFNNQISVLTPNNWNTWKHDMQVLLMHYGCWQFIIQTKPEQPDEEATYKEKLDLQLRKDRCYTLIYTNISSDLKNLITETTDGVAAWKILKDHFEPVTKARVIQLLDQFFWNKIPTRGRCWNLHISCKLAKSKRVSFKKTGAVRSKRPLELLHMDLCGPMPTESQGGNKYFLSIIDDYSRKVTVFPIRNKSDVFHTFIRFQKRAERFLSKKVIAVRTDGGLEFCNKDMDNFLTELGIKHEVTNSYTPEMNGVAERFNLTALDGIKTLLKSSEVPHKFWGEALLCFTYAWNRICHKDSNKTPFEKYSGRKPSVLHLKPFGCLAYAGVPKQIRKKFDMRAKIGIMMGYAQRTKGYRIWLIDENKLVETINVRFDENKRGINFRQKVNSNLGYNLNLPDYYDDEDDFDRVKDSLTSRLVSKTSTETPSTSEKPDVSSDNHSLIPCTEVKWIRNIGRKVTGSNVYYSIEGEATRLKSLTK